MRKLPELGQPGWTCHAADKAMMDIRPAGKAVWKVEAWPWHVLAFLFYLGTALAVSWHGTNLRTRLLGEGSDPIAYTWFLAWWPYALQHHLNPFFTHLVWTPGGLNLGWTTSIPTLALVALPLTVTAGPVLAYDVLMLMAPVCAGMGAYGLCLYISRRPMAAIIGGWLFGFSSFAAAHLNQQLNLEWTALLPLLVWVGLRRINDHSGCLFTVLALSLLLVAQSGFSLEVFATLIVMAAFAWGLAWFTVRPMRPRLIVIAADITLAAPITFVLMVPMLFAMFGQPHDMHLPKLWPAFYVTTPLNFFIPTEATWLGGHFFLPVSSRYIGLVCEQGAYLGLPLLFILWRYLRQGGWFLPLLFGGILLASCGPELIWGGREMGIPLPWGLMMRLPLIGNALPARLMAYASLVAAIIVSLWLAETTRHWRWVVATLAVLFLWPAQSAVKVIPFQPLFQPGQIQKAIGHDKNVLILPFGIFSPSMFWQMESGFAFSQAGGYLGFPPKRVQTNSKIMRLFFGFIDPGVVEALAVYCQTTHVDDLIVMPGTDQRLVDGLRSLQWPVKFMDGASIYSVPSLP
ncbi:hypothetical protein [Acidocella aminolytica]|nr:hypothetical protein [Acidocella aminolytica]